MNYLCTNCLTPVTKSESALKRANGHPFCSQSCAASYNNTLKPKRKPEGKCKQCGESCSTARTYCSQECRILSNRQRQGVVKKSLYGKCATCGNSCSKHVLYCSDPCKPTFWGSKETEDKTIGSVIGGREKSNRYSYIRWHARKKALTLFQSECANCGYSKAVECCHKKAIADFPLTAAIREVNHSDNLILLCPNCHWEADHNYLDITTIKSKANPPDAI